MSVSYQLWYKRGEDRKKHNVYYYSIERPVNKQIKYIYFRYTHIITHCIQTKGKRILTSFFTRLSPLTPLLYLPNYIMKQQVKTKGGKSPSFY